MIAAVADWNPLDRITVHCITVGTDLDRRTAKGFLRRLASEGGAFAEEVGAYRRPARATSPGRRDSARPPRSVSAPA